MTTPRLFLNRCLQISQTADGDLEEVVTPTFPSDCCVLKASGENIAGFGDQSGMPREVASRFPDVSVPAIGWVHQWRCPKNSRHSGQIAPENHGKHSRSRRKAAEKEGVDIANPTEREK